MEYNSTALGLPLVFRLLGLTQDRRPHGEEAIEIKVQVQVEGPQKQGEAGQVRRRISARRLVSKAAALQSPCTRSFAGRAFKNTSAGNPLPKLLFFVLELEHCSRQSRREAVRALRVRLEDVVGGQRMGRSTPSYVEAAVLRRFSLWRMRGVRFAIPAQTVHSLSVF